MIRVSRGLTSEEIQKRFAKIGLTVTNIEDYQNIHTPLVAVDKEGYKTLLATSSVSSGNKSFRRFYKNNPFTIDNIKLWVKLNDPEYELISNEYNGSGEKLEWRITSRPDLPTFFTSWHMFLGGNRHPLLGAERMLKTREKSKLTPKEARKMIEKELESISGDWTLNEKEEYGYKGVATQLRLTSKLGFKTTIRFSSIKSSDKIVKFDLRRVEDSTHNMYRWVELYSDYKIVEGQEYSGGTDHYLFVCVEHGECYGRFDSIRSRKTICRECISESLSGANNPNWESKGTGYKKPSEEEVKMLFYDKGLLIEDFSNYDNVDSKLFATDECGYKVVVSYNNLKIRKDGDHHQIFHKSNPYTIDNIKLWVKLNDPKYELISTEYHGKDELLEWKMLNRPDLPTFFTSWHMFYSGGSRHPELGQQRAADGKRRKPDVVRRTVDEVLQEKYDGWTMNEGEEFKYTGAGHTFLRFTHKDGYISTSLYDSLFAYESLWLFHIRIPKESSHNMYLWIEKNSRYELIKGQCYTGTAEKYKFTCEEHGEFVSSLQTFLLGQVGCSKCVFEAQTGEGNGNWNPSLTDEERENRYNRAKIEPNYQKWRREALKRDNHTCQICGSEDNPVVHHKDGWHWCASRRVDPTNAVTLCTICHDDYHLRYGYYNSTEEKFEKYVLEMRELIKDQLSDSNLLLAGKVTNLS